MLSYDKHQNRSPYLFLQAIRTRKLYMLYMEGHKKTNKSRLSKVCNKSFGQLVCNNTPKPNLKIISNEILNNHLNKTNEDHTDFHDDFVLSQEISGSGVSSSKKLKSTKLQSIHLNISEHKSPKTETPQKVREEEENDALKEQGTSPVLGSALSKYESCKGFLASTPANLSNVSSPENRKSDFVLNILDRLCSPILGKRSVGTSDKSQIKSNQPKSSSLRPSKRLFSDTFDSNFPEPKRNKECNTLKKTENDSDASDDDPFKVHDISEHTLQALCEATDHIVDHLEVEEVSDTTLKKYSYQIKNRHSSSHKSQKSTSMNVAHLPNRNNRNQKCFSDEKNETLNKLVNNSSLIYRNCLSSLDTFRKLSVTDLLIPVKILEEAKNPINNNSICNQNHLLNNGIKSQSLSSYNLMKSCTKGKTKELNLYPDLKKTSESVISKNELMNVDDSLIITDTQYCELVDAAEMVSDFDETFTEFFEERRNYLKNNTVDSKKYPSEVNNFHMKSVQEGGCDELPNSLSKTVSETQKVLFPSRQKNSAKVTFIEESLKTTEQFLKKHTHKEKLTLEGFQTAGSKNVKIPQDQLERELFDREEMCVTPKCSIIQSASDNGIQVSEDSLKIAKQKFYGEEMCDAPQCNGFKTAAGKTVKISEESLKKAKQLLDCEEPCKVTTFLGFQTAGGKTVKIAEESLNKAKQLFDGEDIGIASKPGGFQTGCCNVFTSEESLKREKHLVNDEELCQAKLEQFQTAIGETVKISEESLKEAKQATDVENTHIGPKFDEFTTAGGKTVKVSEESLKKAKELFVGEETCVTTKFSSFQSESDNKAKTLEDLFKRSEQWFYEEGICDAPKFDGFKTAAGKSVKISEESLIKAKELLDCEEQCKVTTFLGFQTAGGNTVKVSEESLNKAKQLFDGEDIEIASKSDGFQTGCCNVFTSEESVKREKHLVNHEELYKAKLEQFQPAIGETVKISEVSLKKAKKLIDVEDAHIGPKFGGFQTAGGKTVEISEQSLMKEKQLFGEDDIVTASKFDGFQTAGGKAVKISEQSLKKAKQLFGEDDIVTDSKFDGFQTAGGKTVKISEQSLKKAKQLFGEDDIVTASKFDGFQTAGGKTVKISEQSLMKAKQLLGEDDIVTASKFDGFQTAGGKAVKISEQSLKKAKQLFGEDDIVTDSKFDGFQTAGGKTVKISEQSLKKAKQLFGEDDIVTASKFDGFQTAGGKTVKISEQSLMKAKQLFGEDDIVSASKFDGFQTAGGKTVEISEQSLMKEKQLFGEDDIVTASKFHGFQTAGGKAVKISEQSLKKAKQLLSEDDIVTATKFHGFQTAGGKAVKISELSLMKAKQLLGEDDIVTASKFDGFQTAGGKAVKISEQSLKKAKQLFGEDDIVTDSNFDGFQTAGGKTVEISEQSLKKAKQLFGEDDIVSASKLDGFQTAGGKTVKTSEESIKRAKQLFDCEEQGKFLKLKGFQTAGGKTVEISEESLQKAKQLFDGDEMDIAPQFDGLETTCGNTVLITRDALKSKQMHLNELCNDPAFEDHQNGSAKEALNISNQNMVPCSSREFHLMDNSFSEIADKSDNIKHFVNCEIYPIKAIDTDPEVKKNCILQTYKKSVSKLKKKFRENDESNTDIVNPPKKPRKLFEGIELHNIHNTLNNHSPVTISLNSSNLCSSVISEEDLNLLNQSAIKTSSHISSLREIGSENYNIDIPEKNFVLSPNVAREVSESMAALMADEESSSPFSKSLLKPCLSSPSMVFDRQLKLPPIDCFEGDVYINDKQLSPVLGSFSNLKNAKCCKKGLQSPDKKSTPKINSVSFNLPYVTSTPNEATIRSKNIQSNHKCLESVIEENENEWKFCNKASIVELEIARKKAGDDQENLIKEKLKLSKSIRSCKGSYLLRKQVESGRSLKSLGELKHLQHKELNQLRLLGIKRTVIDVSASNAVDFRFFARDYYSEDICSSNVDGIPLGDSALLILAGDGTAGVVEITRAFLASPNVDPSLVSQEWVRNHYRWIVLKMAATERMFPENLANKYLTPDNLMFQLKYRYDREIDMCQRSALRKILEKDESSSKPMVLFVADILNVSDVEGSGEKEGKELVLSDGWYSVTASIDREMSLMVRRSVVRVGTKLLVVGADLVNNEDGCHPLETPANDNVCNVQTPANVRLRIWTNSTRRARWYARLGFCRHVPPPARLEKVLGRGGTVPALSSTVARTYPLLFLEKLPDGKTVIRGERAEQTAGDAYQLRRQQCAETILSQLQSETDAGASRSRRKQHSVTRTSLKHVTNTRELLSLLEGVEDISIFQEVLTKDQLNVIQEHRQEEASRLQQQLQDKLIKRLDEKIAPRVVTRMLKVRLVDEEKQSNRSAMLTVWNPSDDVMSLLTEGNVLTFHNLTASGYSRYGDLQLTSSRQTRYSLHRHSVLPRQVTPLSALHDAGYMPQFSEVDVVGLVLPRNDVAENSRLLYVSDANYNFLGISFCMDVKDTGFAHILTPGSVICASNLHWSCNRVSWSLPSVFATEVSSFSQHPRQKHLHEALQQLKERLSSLDSDTYRDECVKRIKSLIAQRNSGGSAQTSATTPTVSSVPITSSSSNEKSTTVVANSKLHSASLESCDTPTSRKLAWLEQFGEPPPLSPLALSTPTRLKRSFRPPKKNIDESR